MRQFKTYEVRVYSNGDVMWYFNDRLHRDEGPAVIYPNGSKYYFRNGVKHREDGPAIIYPDGHTCYYLNGTFLSKKSFDLEMKRKAIKESPKSIDVFEVR